MAAGAGCASSRIAPRSSPACGTARRSARRSPCRSGTATGRTGRRDVGRRRRRAEVDDETLRRVYLPRPGHADLVGVLKYDRRTPRHPGARQRRETAARVAAGAVAKQLLEELGVAIGSHVVMLGGVGAAPRRAPATTSTPRSTPRRSAASTRRRGPHDRRDRRGEAGTATRWAASSRSSSRGSRSASAPTSRGTASWTAASPAR
jgi:hypothetical protein